MGDSCFNAGMKRKHNLLAHASARAHTHAYAHAHIHAPSHERRFALVVRRLRPHIRSLLNLLEPWLISSELSAHATASSPPCAAPASARGQSPQRLLCAPTPADLRDAHSCLRFVAHMPQDLEGWLGRDVGGRAPPRRVPGQTVGVVQSDDAILGQLPVSCELPVSQYLESLLQ